MLRSASSARQGIRARGRLARASPRAALAPAGAWIRRPRRKTIAASHSGRPKYRTCPNRVLVGGQSAPPKGTFHGPSRMVRGSTLVVASASGRMLGDNECASHSPPGRYGARRHCGSRHLGDGGTRRDDPVRIHLLRDGPRQFRVFRGTHLVGTLCGDKHQCRSEWLQVWMQGQNRPTLFLLDLSLIHI